MPDLVANGLRLHVSERGSGSPLVLLHGFTGSAASWWPVIDRLAERHRVIALDLIGHGRSAAPRDPARYRFELALDYLAAIAAQLDVDRAAWLGYSMGGRLALGLAAKYPHLVSAMILESASPGIDDASERETRRQSDASLATSIEDDGIPAFVARWERLPLWATQQRLTDVARRRQREIRLRHRPHGLANSLRGMGQGSQPSYWPRLRNIATPTLLIAGERDEKFADLARRMHAAIPNSRLAIVPDAGHAVHLELPDTYAESVISFLETVNRSIPLPQEEQCA